MAKHITVRAAQPNTKDQEIEPVYLTITGCFPYSIEVEELERTREGFKEDAERLFIGLRSLPGGTFDQLLILMLQKSASSFVVPHNFHDESLAPDMLSALKVLVHRCEPCEIDFTDQEEAWREAKRLIAKAEGKEAKNA